MELTQQRSARAESAAPSTEERGRWQAWAPILARVFATALALLGLAGIGWAARGSHELSELATAPLSFGLAQIASAGGGAPAPKPPAAAVAAAPSRQPCAPAPDRAPASAVAQPGPGLTADGRVVLNLAGAAELQRLPGVGAKRAAAILELRQRLGRLRRPSDLLRVKGIGPRLLERILPLTVLDAETHAPARKSED